MLNSAPTLPPSSDGETANPTRLYQVLINDEVMGAQPSPDLHEEIWRHIVTRTGSIDPKARAARANWLARRGDHALALIHRACLVADGLCAYCGNPLRSPASRRRGASEYCFTKHRR